MGKGCPSSAPGTWLGLPGVLVSSSRGTTAWDWRPLLSPLPSFPALGEEAPPASPSGSGAAETGTECKPSPQPSSPASGQSSRTLYSLEPRTRPAAIPADSLGSSCLGRGGPGPLIQQTLSHSPLRIGELPSKATNFHGPEETGLLMGRPRWSIFRAAPSPPGCPPPRPPPPLAVEVRHLLALFFPAGRQARALVSGASIPINRPSISHVDPL